MSLCKVEAVKMTLHLVPKGFSNYTHPQTGALISVDEIKMTNDAIKMALDIKDAGSLAYSQTMKATNGDKGAAKQASWDAMDGKGLTNLWDELCNQGHIICLVVTCPRCDNNDEMYSMEKMLKMMICKIDGKLYNQCVDIFTSRFEIGTVGETTCICRFPIYLGQAVKALAATFNISTIGAHKFRAKISFEGRHKLKKTPVDQWADVRIGGIPLQELTTEQLQNTNWNYFRSDQVMQALEGNHQALLNASNFDLDPEKQIAQMELSIFPDEIETIQKTKTWHYAQEIFKGGTPQMMAMFKMAGEIIKVFKDTEKPHPPTVSVLDGYVECYPHTGMDMFLATGPGKYFLTFDPPFVLKMKGDNKLLFCDVPGQTEGLMGFYCIQYNMLEDGQMTIFTAGVVFMQHVNVNMARLSTLQHVMKQQLSALSCQMAVQGSEQTNAAGASSATCRPELVRLGLGNSPN